MTTVAIKAKKEQYDALLRKVELKRSPYDGVETVMPSEEEQECGRMFDDLDELKKSIDHDAAKGRLDARATEHQTWADEPDHTQATQAAMEGAGTKRGTKSIDDETGVEFKSKLQRMGFKSWLRNGLNYMGDSSGENEFKALQADSDTRGGYIVAPKMVVQGLIEQVDDMVHIRQLGTVHQVERGQSLGAPTRDNDISDPVWTNEIGTGDEDDTEPFGMRELDPSPLAKRIKISNKLLNAPGIDIEQYWRGRLAYKFGVAMENAFLTGNGRNQPLGLLTDSASGLDTDRDVKTGAADGIVADALFDSQYFLKQQYWAKAQWMWSREAVKRIRKLKDAENQYLWQPGLQLGQPDRILNFPFIMSEFMPDTFTAGSYVGIFADFSWYWIVDALTMETQRLVELYAEKNQTGFIARLESDGQPMLPEAFCRVICGA